MRPLWVILVGAFLIVVICVLGIFLIVSPKTKKIAELQGQVTTEEGKAYVADSACSKCHKDYEHPASANATPQCGDCHFSDVGNHPRPAKDKAGMEWKPSGVHAAEQDVEKAKEEERQAKADYEELAREKTLPINTGSQIEYVINLWHIYREDFPQLYEQFVADLEREYDGLEVSPDQIDLGAPPMTPAPTTRGFLKLPAFDLQVTGTYDQIKAVLRSLKNFPRAAVSFTGISAMTATSDGRVSVSISCQPYLMVEEPPGAAAPAARAGGAAGGMGMMPGAGGGPMMMPPGGGSMMPPGGGGTMMPPGGAPMVPPPGAGGG